MELISKIITAVLDALLIPFGEGRHALGLAWLSLLTGVGMALVFKLTSDTRKIKQAKDLGKSFILEMRIYRDDAGTIFASFFRSLRANLVYLRHMLPPFLAIVVPAALIFMQLDERYGRSHLPAGSTTVLSVFLAEGAGALAERSSVACGPGVAVEAGPVWISGTRELAWRLRIDAPGTHDVAISIDGSEYVVPLVAETAHRMIGHARSSSVIESLLHPGLPPIPDGSPIETVRLRYPGARYPLLFWRTHWIAAFLVYSLIGAAAVKLVVGFEI
jgi:hypothetical protein